MFEALLVALALELLDWPRWWRGYLVSRLIPPQIHPVSLFYRAVSPLARGGGLARGVAVAATAPLGALAVWSLAQATAAVPPPLSYLAEGYLLKLTFSITHILYPCMRHVGTPAMRHVAQQFVRRDLSNAGPRRVNSACLEAAAESLVDSFVSPLLWYLLLGLPGAWLQRLVNTLDGLVGFREKGALGAPSAYMDTFLNYVPARVAALLILAAGGFKRLSILQHRRRVPSVNAGWPIAALAAALGVRLEKAGHYTVGVGDLPDADAVRRGLRIVAAAAAAWALAAVTLAALIRT
ncbi:MAG: cobalamin biosynthesis protein [Pyrobaculum sp.]|nr:cobalamin biosynthesis protein [Pyrobaculum sp.]